MSILPFAVGFAVMRVVIGLAPVVAARPSSRLLGFPEAHDNPTSRLMARLFGVRDIGLGVLVLACLEDLHDLRRTFLFNLVTDLADAAMIAIPLVKREGIDRAARLSLAFALIGAACWAAAWRVSA